VVASCHEKKGEFHTVKKVILYLVLGLLSLSSFGLNSVAAKGQQQVSNPAIPYNGNLLVECISGYEAYSYNLWAGQTNDAGSVVITTDGTSLVVTVNALGELDDVHVYLYTEDQVLPSSRPIPGHAPYVANNIEGSSVELVIPLPEDGVSYTLAIHVAFEDVDASVDPYGLAGETAYAAGETPTYEGRGAWFYLVAFTVVECEVVVDDAPVIYIAAHAALTNQETAWALGQFTFIETGIGNKWGWFIELDLYGTHEYEIYYGAGRNNLDAGTLIGTLVVEYTETEITITYVLTQPLLEEVQVFVGYEYPTTGAPGQYDYKVQNLNGISTVEVVVLVEDLA
jgi:hypothetical protein